MALAAQLVLAFLIGGLVGVAELLVRFRDDPMPALKLSASTWYVALNGSASVLALILIVYLDVSFGVAATAPLGVVLQIFVAGFGAMAFLRSSLFIVKMDNKDLPIGPAYLIQTFLDTVAEAMERERATQRSAYINKKLDTWPLERVAITLPSYIFSLREIDNALQVKLGNDIRAIASSVDSDISKKSKIGLLLVRAFGQLMLTAAIKDCPP